MKVFMNANHSLEFFSKERQIYVFYNFIMHGREKGSIFILECEVLHLVCCIKFYLRFPLFPSLLAWKIFYFYTMCLQVSKPSSGMNWIHCMFQLYILCEPLFSTNMWNYLTSLSNKGKTNSDDYGFCLRFCGCSVAYIDKPNNSLQ